MSKSRKISPQEWIADYFSPHISILSSSDVDELLIKNNLTLTELLQPFSSLGTDVTLKDHDGINHSISSLKIHFSDFKKDPIKLISSKLLSDFVNDNVHEEPFVEKFGLSAPGYTPWFDTWMKFTLHSMPMGDHEFIRNHFGTLVFISSNALSPIEKLQGLSSSIHQRQDSKYYPNYFSSNPLKYYVLLHEDSEPLEKAQVIFSTIQAEFGSTLCHLLVINSRRENTCDPNVVSHWFSSSSSTIFKDVEARYEGFGHMTPSCSLIEEEEEEKESALDETPNHPLALALNSSSIDIEYHDKFKLKPVNRVNICQYLSVKDIEEIQRCVREFIIHGLIPYVERQLRSLFEIVSNRKSRSLFSGAKRWFGKPGSSSTSSTSVIYGKEAPELQIRKLADLYFMMKLYKSAHQYYHTAKKDFFSDEAWNYYAGAAEMTTLSHFMLSFSSNLPKKYYNNYIEDAITKYLQICQMPEFAIRATLFDALCLKYMGMYQEAAASYIRITTENKDFRSSLLLEQAAYCFLLISPPWKRKYAFHIILAAYRYSKAGQKKHSARSYEQGYQVYKGLRWYLSENHILFNMAHQHLLYKNYIKASQLFNELFSLECSQMNSFHQQSCHLQEYFIIHHMLEKDSPAVPINLAIPKFFPQEHLLNLNTDGIHEINDNVNNWQLFEKIILERIVGQEIFPFHSTCQSLFGETTDNRLHPQGVVNEPILFIIPVSNPFSISLLLKKINLLWSFIPENKKDESGPFVKNNTNELFTLDKNSKMKLTLCLTPLVPGKLTITGVEYQLKGLFPHSDNSDYNLKGKQDFSPLFGPKKNTKSNDYELDNRYEIIIRAPLPKLKLTFLNTLPTSVAAGEILIYNATFVNSSSLSIGSLYLVSDSPGTFSFNSKRKSLYEYPIIQDSSLLVHSEDGSKTQRSLDIISVPIDKLEAGKSSQLQIWLHVPQTLGSCKINMIFIYGEMSASLNKHRMNFHELHLDIFPSLQMTPSLTPIVHLDVKLQNLCHFFSVVKVSHVGILSSSLILDSIMSKNEDKLVEFGNNESRSLVFKCISSKDASLLNFSSFNEKGSKINFHAPPYLDFVKKSFSFPSKSLPELNSDVVLLVWKTGTRNGFIFAPIAVKVVKEGDTTDGVVPSLIKLPLTVKISIASQGTFDFTSRTLFKVHLKVSLCPLISDKKCYFHYKWHLSQTRILGNSRAFNILITQYTELDFALSLTRPGLYSFKDAFHYQVTQMPKFEENKSWNSISIIHFLINPVPHLHTVS